jgi:hypothetical protein
VFFILLFRTIETCTFKYDPLKVCDNGSFSFTKLGYTLSIVLGIRVFKLFDVSEAGSAFVIKCKGEKNPTRLGPLDRAGSNGSN